ncbi:shikimate dehydrogenase family protein [Bordetella genomosp. 9]|uniref:shikimate dehydrogenase (NADP(+)) n=1 Tax=Bordetella genomosp. 9 TaxID=1416803 RepID=A0A1W6YZK3_9BORD|nr:shikimate dehydrogenase [Bordetella genomosp. 9]ARP86421.1 shikimate dehydrogenase [Bordetella genomosp. 9]
MTPISGKTRVFGILADPIHHVQAPARLNAYFADAGYDGVMIPMHVRPDSLPAVVAGLRGMENLGGVVVTVPHKTAILALCDEASEVTRQIGAANVVRRDPDGRLVATMLDGEGFVRGLLGEGRQVQGRQAYLAGAGGAANAIAFALVQAGVARLTIANRTAAKAEDLRRRVLALHPHADVRIGNADPSGHDLVINGTSLGLRPGDALPLDVSRLSPAQLVCEVIMQPKETALLLAARERGCAVHYGAPMLASQLALMAEFLGVPSASPAA